MRSENAQNLLMCVQQSQTPFIQSIFILYVNIIYTWMVKDLDVKFYESYWYFSPRMTLDKRLKLREELVCSMITRSENAALKDSNNKNDFLS